MLSKSVPIRSDEYSAALRVPAEEMREREPGMLQTSGAVPRTAVRFGMPLALRYELLDSGNSTVSSSRSARNPGTVRCQPRQSAAHLTTILGGSHVGRRLWMHGSRELAVTMYTRGRQRQ